MPSSRARSPIWTSLPSITSCAGGGFSRPYSARTHSSFVRRRARCSTSMRRAAVVFPVPGSPTVRNRVGCLILISHPKPTPHLHPTHARPPVPRAGADDRWETGGMLELRPNCECCDVDLLPESTEAMICTFECTWCARCLEVCLGGTCPNCGGHLERRPVRPAAQLDAHPASTQRVFQPGLHRS